MNAFFKKEKKEKKLTEPAKVTSARVSAEGGIFELSHVIINPRITEKSTWHSAQGVYVFDVDLSANKQQIAQAVRAIYKVNPRKVHVVTVQSKSKRNARTGKLGMKGGGKKAYVYLKKGETITLQ
ncbi:MAG: 50S ribosomal protein L23 [bacterium]|nr:50S ribosomal protein L23 [bacterium]